MVWNCLKPVGLQVVKDELKLKFIFTFLVDTESEANRVKFRVKSHLLAANISVKVLFRIEHFESEVTHIIFCIKKGAAV